MENYTPRQMAAFLYFASVRQRREQAQSLSLQTMAARGEKRALEKMHKELGREV